jgi:hypothetical protein
LDKCTECVVKKDLVDGKCLDKPKAVAQLAVTNAKFDKSESVFRLSFNHRLQPADFKSFLSIAIDSKSKEAPKFNLESVTLSKDGKSLEFKIDIQSSIRGAKISVLGMNSTNMLSILTPHSGAKTTSSTNSVVSNGEIVNYYYGGASIDSDPVDFYVPESKSLETTAKKHKKTISTTLKAASMIPLLLAPAQGMKTLKVFQVFDLMRFVNVEMPENTRAFLDIFDSNALDFIPSLPQIDEKRDISELEWELMRQQNNNAGNTNGRILLNSDLQFQESYVNKRKDTCELHEIFI